MIVIENKFNLEQLVYLRTDKDQLPRLVTGINIRQGDRLLYELSSGSTTSWHNDFEISVEKNVEVVLTN